jgi:RNA polymerase sigma-70 factor (ECF subfamily)
MLAARSRDIAGAEDALGDAFLSALRTWPERGIPDNPDAWLLTAARNAGRNAFRHQRVHDASAAEFERSYESAQGGDPLFPDERRCQAGRNRPFHSLGQAGCPPVVAGNDHRG